ncbi:hypothetical protein EJ08DRAFT_8736 [Tothia fuscella]|uniref:Secreted protein n=1 Tax=Tothia fuscella TaxID=1048955 RepID=A0A9P4U4H1_9PEZI|nr:hypothetical protein EJ08DRAFT_8736 [Tothia fuscella]
MLQCYAIIQMESSDQWTCSQFIFFLLIVVHLQETQAFCTRDQTSFPFFWRPYLCSLAPSTRVELNSSVEKIRG